MRLRTLCIETVNTTTVVVLFCICYCDSVIRLGPTNVRKAGKESQSSLVPPPHSALVGRGKGRDKEKIGRRATQSSMGL